MLRIFKKSDAGNILNKDLTGIVTDPAWVAHYSKEMRELCRVLRGVGLAANQVGLTHNFFFAAAGAKVEKRGDAGLLCINPTWTPNPGAALLPINGEGCLSLPNRLFSVQRYTSILASWQNSQGHHRNNVKLTGLAAQVFQHEHDHLRGITLEESGHEIMV